MASSFPEVDCIRSILLHHNPSDHRYDIDPDPYIAIPKGIHPTNEIVHMLSIFFFNLVLSFDTLNFAKLCVLETN